MSSSATILEKLSRRDVLSDPDLGISAPVPGLLPDITKKRVMLVTCFLFGFGLDMIPARCLFGFSLDSSIYIHRLQFSSLWLLYLHLRIDSYISRL